MEHVAKAVNKHPIWVKELNLYQKNQVRQQKPSQGAIPIWEKIEPTSISSWTRCSTCIRKENRVE